MLTLFLIAELLLFVLLLNASSMRSFVQPLQAVFTQLRENAAPILAALDPQEVKARLSHFITQASMNFMVALLRVPQDPLLNHF